MLGDATPTSLLPASRPPWLARSLRLLAAVGLILAGCGDTMAEEQTVDRDPGGLPSTSPLPPRTSPPRSPSTSIAGADTEQSDQQSSDVAVVFAPSGLTPELRTVAAELPGVRRLARLDRAVVDMVSSIDADGRRVEELSDGFRIQLDARAYDNPAALAEMAPGVAALVADLENDEVLLTTGAAELRRLGVGGTITLVSGQTVTVAGVVPETVLGSVEIVFANLKALKDAGAVSIRPSLLVDYQGDAAVLEQALLLANGGRGVRVFGGRGAQDRDLPTPVLSVLEVKQLFGEFSFRPSGGRSVEIDPDWFDDNIVLVEVPIIGAMRCHRIFAEALSGVMADLVRDGLEEMIDLPAYQGCWTPRFIGGSKRLSRHSWGVAADINFGNDLDYSLGSPVHPILLNRMAEAGLVSGHRWVVADPGHFEYVGPDRG